MTDSPVPATTFVLVHGGRHGGWAWRKVAEQLRARGHRVYTPTFTGLGERHHLLHAGVGLDVHVSDLVELFRFEDLDDVVVVAHSYGGAPVAGAAEHLADRIRHIVWLDAHLPREGESIFDLIGPERAQQMEQMAQDDNGGRYVPVSDASWWGLSDPDTVAWVNAHTTPQPIKTYRDRIGPTRHAWELAGTMIECSPSRLPAVELTRQRRRADDDPTFDRRVIDACHEPMITHPVELTRLLEEAATRR